MTRSAPRLAIPVLPFLRVALLALALLAAAPALAQPLTPEQRGEVVEILREALKRDPSILREAFATLEQAEQQERAAAQREAILAQSAALLRDPADPVRGNPRGDLAIVEFFDVRCGYCKMMHPAIQALLAEDPQIRVVMKDLPVLGPASVMASRALLAAQRQDRYAAYQDALMQLRGEPTEAALRVEAERVGLDWTRLRRDMEDPAIQARLRHNLELARQMSIQGTPALVIGGTLVPGAVDLPALRQLVEQARREGAGRKDQ